MEQHEGTGRALPGGRAEARGLVDANQFLRVAESLKRSLDRLDNAALSESSRQRWQRRLMAVTDLAKSDLDSAEAQCRRFEADFAREVGNSKDVKDR